MAKNCGLIILDPGHGPDGNPFGDFFEGTQNYILEQALAPLLEEGGFTVKSTRETPADDPSLVDRGHMAGDMHARLFLSLHSDAPGSDLAPEDYVRVRGVTAYYSIADESANAALSEKLTAAASAAMKTSNRGIRTRISIDYPGKDYYGVLRASAESGCKRAVLLECGFHTNKEDASALTEPESVQKLAHAIADVILKSQAEGTL